MKKVVAPATHIATQRIAKDFPALPKSFFCRPAEVVGPELVGCHQVAVRFRRANGIRDGDRERRFWQLR